MIHAFICQDNLVYGAVLCEHKRPRVDLIESVNNPHKEIKVLVLKDSEYNDLWKECIQSPYFGSKPKFHIKENKLLKV
tara:strand:- start:693 stop:926 length:234 start_codon:yes stop_codon:yes gene_type:complete